MSMNIKSKDAHQLARELATLTGETLTAAVTEAVRERLDRVRRPRETKMAEQLLEIGRDCAAHLGPASRTTEHGDLLYDDRGLPK